MLARARFALPPRAVSTSLLLSRGFAGGARAPITLSGAPVDPGAPTLMSQQTKAEIVRLAAEKPDTDGSVEALVKRYGFRRERIEAVLRLDKLEQQIVKELSGAELDDTVEVRMRAHLGERTMSADRSAEAEAKDADHSALSTTFDVQHPELPSVEDAMKSYDARQ